LKVAIIAVGSVKEKYFIDACDAYLKRLAPISPLEMITIKEEFIADERDGALIRKALQAEGQRIIARLSLEDEAVAMTPDGEPIDSQAFARLIDPLIYPGVKRLVFIIGSSHGLSPEVYSGCGRKLSFGPMTYPHQLARLMLIEQIYRARMIQRGRPYHK
jgi:23S rRNA (pseudouridine1915-N3)-methyltransferase